jgi:hypothetical protein
MYVCVYIRDRCESVEERLFVCMCVCMYVCMLDVSVWGSNCVGIWSSHTVCMYVGVCVCVCVCMYVCMHAGCEGVGHGLCRDLELAYCV